MARRWYNRPGWRDSGSVSYKYDFTWHPPAGA
jgi:hypothetical protein